MFIIPLIVSLLITAAGVTIEVQKAHRQQEQAEEVRRETTQQEGPPAPDSEVDAGVQAPP